MSDTLKIKLVTELITEAFAYGIDTADEWRTAMICIEKILNFKEGEDGEN